jgi:hypothetical protein
VQFENIAKALNVKPSHCGEAGDWGFGVSLLQLLDEDLHIGRDYSFRGLLLLLVAVRCGLVNGCAGGDHEYFLLGLLHWPLPLNRAAARRNMPKASWRRRGQQAQEEGDLLPLERSEARVETAKGRTSEGRSSP